MEAILYYRKHMASSSTPMEQLRKAAAILAYQPDTPFEPYKVPPHHSPLFTQLTPQQSLFSQSRWTYLAQHFRQTHHTLFSLPSRPLLQIALTAGLSCLKTPACKKPNVPSPSTTTTTSTPSLIALQTQTLCPICSSELNGLSEVVPYAHHTKSEVASDPIVLPNMRIYGRAQLTDFAKRIGMREGWVRDPVTGEEFEEGKVRPVYIS